ncbi:MAG: hypothetical protein LLG40_15425 [Deltaproteobacteria bacterium]|jgi:hypothetical protein|nr:hypothetical protein [Deltaproteobacteria bacterium]
MKKIITVFCIMIIIFVCYHVGKKLYFLNSSDEIQETIPINERQLKPPIQQPIKITSYYNQETLGHDINNNDLEQKKRELIDAQNKISEVERDNKIKDLELQRQKAINELQEKQQRLAELNRLQKENDDRLMRHEEELKALKKQNEDIDKSGAEMIRKIKESVK